VLVEPLADLGYQLIETGMVDRLFFRPRPESGLAFHLHIVEPRDPSSIDDMVRPCSNLDSTPRNEGPSGRCGPRSTPRPQALE
jgi:hypothetical protein